MRALIVDDSRTIRQLIGRIVADLGFEVFEAGDGKQALERLGAIGPVDLVLVDWNMPVMDGLELIRAVRADHAYDPMCLVMITTESEASQVSLALEAGANEYVMKPFDKAGLLAKLEMLGITGR